LGASYGSLQIYCQPHEEIREVLDELAVKRKSQYWLGPQLGSWTGVYPVLHGADPSVASDLARRLRGELFYLMVHDDDVFAYEYYHDGKRIDQYCSRPDYLGQPTASARKALRGRPQKFAHLAKAPERFADFQTRIAEQFERPAVFASELLISLASALGMANAQTSYEYLSDGEDDVDGWDQFVHIPDHRVEQARARKDNEAHQAEVHRMMREGLLLAERGGQRGREVPDLRWCPAPDGAGFLMVAAGRGFSFGERVPVERIGPPWSAGPKPIGLMIDPATQKLFSSPSGRFLANWSANSDPSASVWDLTDGRCVAKLPRGAQNAHHITFLPDESAIVCSCGGMQSGRITIVPLNSGEPRHYASHLIPGRTAVHPDGQLLALVDDRSRLSVLDLASGRILHTWFVGGIRMPMSANLFLNHVYPRDWFTMPPDAVDDLLRLRRDELTTAYARIMSTRHASGTDSTEQNLNTDNEQRAAQTILVYYTPKRIESDERGAREALEEARAPQWRERKARSRESVSDVAFDPSGEHLFLATEDGLRVHLWRDILEAKSETPPAILSVEADSRIRKTADGNLSFGDAIRSLLYDADRNWLLFGAANGRVRYLDLATGLTQTLLETPGLQPIWDLVFSRDRSVLALSCGGEILDDTVSRRPMRRSAALQFWDYRAVCDRAGTAAPRPADPSLSGRDVP
jgi:WD40 repeat protein